jgi:hypothetical protein
MLAAFHFSRLCAGLAGVKRGQPDVSRGRGSLPLIDERRFAATEQKYLVRLTAVPGIPGRPSDNCPAESRPLAPHFSTPGQGLGQGIDLIVVTSPREGQKLGGEILKPGRSLGKENRTAGE